MRDDHRELFGELVHIQPFHARLEHRLVLVGGGDFLGDYDELAIVLDGGAGEHRGADLLHVEAVLLEGRSVAQDVGAHLLPAGDVVGLRDEPGDDIGGQIAQVVEHIPERPDGEGAVLQRLIDDVELISRVGVDLDGGFIAAVVVVFLDDEDGLGLILEHPVQRAALLDAVDAGERLGKVYDLAHGHRLLLVGEEDEVLELGVARHIHADDVHVRRAVFFEGGHHLGIFPDHGVDLAVMQADGGVVVGVEGAGQHVHVLFERGDVVVR